MFCSPYCKVRFHQSYPSQKLRGLKRKLKFFIEGGGQCSKCGYRKNLSALAFHHLDPKQKDFNLDARALSNRKEEYILIELKKCVLLCNNCHAETHNPYLNVASLDLSLLL